MSTLPVIDTSLPPLAGPLTVPHFSDGGGWTTELLLVNRSSTTLTGTVEFRDDSGALTTVAIGGQSGSTFAYTVPPHSSRKLSTDGRGPAPIVGSIRVLPADEEAAPVPLVIFSYRPGQTITVTQAGASATDEKSFRIYAESAGTDGQPGAIQSAVAIANNSETPATVTLELTNLDGSDVRFARRRVSDITWLRPQQLVRRGSVPRLAQSVPRSTAPFRRILREFR